MSSEPTNKRGKWFEEFEPGMEVISQGRTVTETDIVNFAGISGDYNQIHTDAVFCKTQPFGARVAHGRLVLSIATGLIAQTGLIEGTIIAFREISSWKFTKPTFISDTVHVVVGVKETKPMPRLGGGLVELDIKVLNQKDEVVMKGFWSALVHSKPE